MADNPDISELLDSYGDGTLSAEEAQRLLARLEQSEELREQLAGVAVAQRLLTAVHAEPVAYERVRRALRARGLMPEQPEAAPPQPVKAPAGRRLAMTPASWNQAKTSAPSSPWLVVGISLTLGLLVAGTPAAEPVPLAEHQIKALYLFNFTKYVEWPAATFASSPRSFSSRGSPSGP